MYGDASLLYRRSAGPAQPDLGSLYCPSNYIFSNPQACKTLGYDYRTFANSEPLYDNVVINQSTLIDDTWTTTGLFALPGKPIKVTRLDNNSDAVTTHLYFWFQREGTTKALELRSDNFSGYDRSQFARSQPILVKPGFEHIISAPFGGPIYIGMTNNLPNKGANNGAVKVTLRVSGVAKHPTILDMGGQFHHPSFPDRRKQDPTACGGLAS